MLKFRNQTTQHNVTALLEAYTTAQAAGWLASHIGSMIAEVEQQAADLEPGIAEAQAVYETAQAEADSAAQAAQAAGEQPPVELVEQKLAAGRRAAALHGEYIAQRRRRGELTTRLHELRRVADAFEALAQEPTAADVRAALRGDLSL